jgi:hypothetical protein
MIMKKCAFITLGFILVSFQNLNADEPIPQEINAKVESGIEPEVSTWGFLTGIASAASTYQEWSIEWRKSEHKISESDRIINHLMESQLLGLAIYFRRNKQPELLEYYLLFVGEQVPKEFDDIWSHSIFELLNIDSSLSAKVDASLKAKGYSPLSHRYNALNQPDIQIPKDLKLPK